MSHQRFGWTHQAELIDPVNTSQTLFPYSDINAVAATSACIIAASLALFYLQKHAPTPLRRPRRHTPSALTHLFLTLDFAIEYPLLLAFHPCTLAYPRDPFGRAELPSLPALVGQVCVCCAVEAACSLALARWSRMSLDKFPAAAAAGGDPALRCTVLFLRPRAAVLLAAAVLGTPASCVTRVTGRLHGVSMAVWILVQQHFGAVGDRVWLLEDE
ncbi:uncharacterized protein BKCO1_8300026 [Diplodia corticola]|uniref:Uncharacterized protein n=1 Tax=Diplodia corticola TaxID=236234 RepID=A0A1J9RN70_9PEZI|nr:uncharacterized protein BKCO1_8300026 [Diplodia corticola]OJD29372.1 hypothetical protein BKCO1_8300026 [Diplodia corticola]